jgi:hypothetical protein
MDKPHQGPQDEARRAERLIHTMLLLNTGIAQLKDHGMAKFGEIGAHFDKLNANIERLNDNVDQLRREVTGGGVVVSQPVSLLFAVIIFAVGIAIGWRAQAILEARSPHAAVHFVLAPPPAQVRKNP